MKALIGQTILITRPVGQSAALAEALRLHGAEVLEAPTLIVAPLPDDSPVDEALARLEQCDWLILTSTNGVEALNARCRRLGLPLPTGRVRVAAIGPMTAARFLDLSGPVDLMPATYTSAGLAEELIAAGVHGKTCLLLRSAGASSELPRWLTKAGAVCRDLPIYRCVPPKHLPNLTLECLSAGTVDWAVFTSPAAFENFVALLGRQASPLVDRLRLVSIGPVTSGAIRRAGWRPAVEAQPHTAAGVVRAILESTK